MKVETPSTATQSTGLDPFEASFHSTELLRTYARRDRVFGREATSTASTTLSWAPVEELGTEGPECWDLEQWLGSTVKQPCIERRTHSPSQSRTPPPQQSSVAELILAVKEELSAAFAERLSERLYYLTSICEQEYPEQAPISPESLEDFVAFLRSIPNLAYPGIVLTPSGNIQAEWRQAKTRHLAVEFVGNGDAHFVVFAPDPKSPYKTIRASGVATVGSLMDIVRPYGVNSWATASGRRAA